MSAIFKNNRKLIFISECLLVVKEQVCCDCLLASGNRRDGEVLDLVIKYATPIIAYVVQANLMYATNNVWELIRTFYDEQKRAVVGSYYVFRWLSLFLQFALRSF